MRLISDIDIPLDSGDFCVMDEKVVDVLVNSMPERGRFVRGLRAYAGFKQIGIEYERDARYAGEPKYTISKLIKLAIDGLFDFSTAPLRLSVYLGLLVSLPAFFFGFFTIIQRLFDIKIMRFSSVDFPGQATLAAGIYFLGGVILVILGF